MCEETPTRDEVVWRVQLEQEQLTRLESLEQRTPTGLPEVCFIDRWLRPQQLEPVQVGDADEGFHVGATSLPRLRAGFAGGFSEEVAARCSTVCRSVTWQPFSCLADL